MMFVAVINHKFLTMLDAWDKTSCRHQIACESDAFESINVLDSLEDSKEWLDKCKVIDWADLKAKAKAYEKACDMFDKYTALCDAFRAISDLHCLYDQAFEEARQDMERANAQALDLWDDLH